MATAGALRTDLPTGTVTFVFSDIEGSTRLTRELGEETWSDLLDRHGRIFRDATAAHGGVVVNTEGDSFFLAFQSARLALDAAIAVQTTLADELEAVRVRIGIHTGEARLGGDDYVGMTVVQAARVSAAVHGGQVVITSPTRHALGDIAPEITFRSLGSHRLKDLGEAQELHQVCHPKLATEFPPLRTLDRVAHNIPVQLSSFLGRVEELPQAAALLGDHRLLTITGPGGSGKTRFAYQLAAEALDRFSDGIWVLELAGVSDPSQLASAALAAFGLREEQGRPPTETLVAWLSTRTALVVLDNCEHLIEAAAALAGTILRGASRTKVLATSREPLRVAGEAVFALAPLATPTDGEELGELVSSEAVQLFTERAADAHTGFSLDEANAAAVGQICTRLEGMPLAIELAAAWVRSLTPAQISERLRDRFDLLDKAVRGADARQASLRAAIGWSYDLLEEPERQLLARLSVFEGGWTLEAAESVCGRPPLAPDEVVHLLGSLVDKSLVVRSSDAVAPRYRMLETVRAFATEQRDAGDDIGPTHAEFFAELAAECAAQTAGSVAQARVFDVLDREAANLAAAIDFLRTADQNQAAAEMAIQLRDWWLWRGHWQTGLASCSPLIGWVGLEPGTAAALDLAAGLLTDDRGYRKELLERAARAAADIGDAETEAEALDGFGLEAFYDANYDLCRSLHEEALAMGKRRGDARAIARSRTYLADLDYRVGRFEEALAGFEDCLRIQEDLGNRLAECEIILGLMTLRRVDLKDHEGAEEAGRRGLELARELGYPAHEASALWRLAQLRYDQDRPEEAGRLAKESLAISQRIGDREDEVYALELISGLAVEAGRPHDARAALLQALASGGGGPRAVTRLRFGLANIALTLGEHHEARDWAQSILAGGSDVGDLKRAMALNRLGRAQLALGDFGSAKAAFQEGIALLDDPLQIGQGEAGLGDVCLEAGDLTAARELYMHALAVARDAGADFYGSAQKLLQIGRLLAAAGHPRDAAELLAAGVALDKSPNETRGWAFEKQQVRSAQESCRVALGDLEYDAAGERGAALDWETAAARAAELLERLGSEDFIKDDGGGLADVEGVGPAPHG